MFWLTLKLPSSSLSLKNPLLILNRCQITDPSPLPDLFQKLLNKLCLFDFTTIFTQTVCIKSSNLVSSHPIAPRHLSSESQMICWWLLMQVPPPSSSSSRPLHCIWHGWPLHPPSLSQTRHWYHRCCPTLVSILSCRKDWVCGHGERQMPPSHFHLWGPLGLCSLSNPL